MTLFVQPPFQKKDECDTKTVKKEKGGKKRGGGDEQVGLMNHFIKKLKSSSVSHPIYFCSHDSQRRNPQGFFSQLSMEHETDEQRFKSRVTIT